MTVGDAESKTAVMYARLSVHCCREDEQQAHVLLEFGSGLRFGHWLIASRRPAAGRLGRARAKRKRAGNIWGCNLAGLDGAGRGSCFEHGAHAMDNMKNRNQSGRRLAMTLQDRLVHGTSTGFNETAATQRRGRGERGRRLRSGLSGALGRSHSAAWGGSKTSWVGLEQCAREVPQHGRGGGEMRGGRDSTSDISFLHTSAATSSTD